jgi:hypothetical protein
MTISESDESVRLDSEQVFIPIKLDSDPIFVLCSARSGSTLLRFILDAHPDLACPPETSLPPLCAQLATVWSLIEGAPLSMDRDDTPPEVPQAAIAGIRYTMDMMLGAYLKRRGKRRYCDKSLGSARYADLLLRVYPNAKFICLYRHPMDMIASGLEACPWGLKGYGFEAYGSETPANSVLALARYWLDNTTSVLAAEKNYPGKCMRIRYEDLASDPDGTMSRVFQFLDLSPIPSISSACFSAERERFGPADHKIWYTSEVNNDSVGRGWSVPIRMLPPTVLSAMNDLAKELNYVPVDGSWGSTAAGTDPRAEVAGAAVASGPVTVNSSDSSGELTEDSAPASGAAEAHSSLGGHLRENLTNFLSVHGGPEAEHLTGSFVLVSGAQGPNEASEFWLVNLDERSVILTDESAQENSDWDMVGSASVWQRVLSGELNFSTAMRSNQLRYCEESPSGTTITQNRLRILSKLLRLTTW